MTLIPITERSTGQLLRQAAVCSSEDTYKELIVELKNRGKMVSERNFVKFNPYLTR